MNKKDVYRGLLLTVICSGITTAVLADDDDDDFVDRVTKAPIVSDGDVAFRQADYVINLEPISDPAGPGIQVLAADQFRVYLPQGTIADNLAEFPVCGVGQPCGSTFMVPVCSPPSGLACSTAVFLRGWPQSPVFPDVDVTNNILTLTARPGTNAEIKQIHFIGKGFQNPGPGGKRIEVKHIRDGNVIASGKGKLKIVPNIRPSINLSSVFAGPNQPGPGPGPYANTVLQGVDDNPFFPWNFLVWDTYGEPFIGITLRKRSMHRYQLRQNGRTVGRVTIDAPDDASGFGLSLVDQGTITTPVIGLSTGGGPAPPTQRYTATFDPGTNPADGCYVTTFKLNNGNSWALYVGAPDRNACADDDGDSDSDSD